MLPSQTDIIKVCEVLAEQEGLRVTANESLKGACYTFAGAFIGGLVGGPVGLGVGSIAAGTLAAYKSQGKFKSVVYVINNEMSAADKQKLVDGVKKVVDNIEASDVITLIAILNSNAILKETILGLIKNSLTQNMGLTLV